MPSISVIVCFYNAENYLARLFLSLLRQTLQDYELILVNDGSSDESLFVCEKYESSFSNIKIINKSNGGLVSARKAGINAASCEFVCCLDADDWIDDDYIETLKKIQEESCSDMVITGHWRELEDNRSKVFGTVKCGTYESKELLDKMIYSGIFFKPGISQYFHGKLFRCNILKKVQCQVDDRIKVGEDVAVIYPAIAMSSRVCIADYCGYHYINNFHSMVSSIGSDEEYRLDNLISYLISYSISVGIYDYVKPQLNQFYKCSLLTRCITKLDELSDDILIPFGGVLQQSNIVLYGAGVLGQRIKKYYIDCGKLNLIKWVDQNYKIYKKNGINVDSPDDLKLLESERYEYIIVAVTDYDTANAIMNTLVEKYRIDKKKMLWLTEDFINKSILK